MKIVHLSTEVSEQSACKRINDSLLENKVDSIILTLKGDSSISHTSKYSILNKAINRLEYYFKNIINKNKDRYISLNITGINVFKNKYFKNSDIIHIHWINGGYISLNALLKMSSYKNIIWTCHDSWPFTSICHVRDECSKYKDGCQKCHLISNKNSFIVNSIIKKKEYIYKNNKIIFVFPSTKHMNYAIESHLFSEVPLSRMKVVGNPIQTNIFYDENLEDIENQIYIGFGAIGGINNPLKGFNHLKSALKNIIKEKKYSSNLNLVIFGSNESDKIFYELRNININIINEGYIKSADKLRRIYSRIDIFVSSSFEESFGQTLAESMACGCLGVAYDNTGSIDIIDDNINGYLAEYKNINNLSEKIILAINKIEEGYNRELSSKSIYEKYNYDKIAKMYMELYHIGQGE